MIFEKPGEIRKGTLLRANPENVLRLARYLKLRIKYMSVRQVIRLIAWRLSRQKFQ